MGSSKIYASLAGFLAVAASTMTARAADLLPPLPAPEPFEVASVGGGWYLRGDIGFSNQNVDRLENVATAPENVSPSVLPVAPGRGKSTRSRTSPHPMSG